MAQWANLQQIHKTNLILHKLSCEKSRALHLVKLGLQQGVRQADWLEDKIQVEF